MFEINVKENNMIAVQENGNHHCIDFEITHWTTFDLLAHWGYEIYNLIDSYSIKLLYLSMTVNNNQGYLRAFRTVRTIHQIHFDDVLFAVPWKLHSWNPMEAIEYANSPKGHARIDYSFDAPNRIPEFSVSHEELSHYLSEKLEKAVPVDYESSYKLWYGEPST